MKLLSFFKNLFKKKIKAEEPRLVIRPGLPLIPERVPLVFGVTPPKEEEPNTPEELDFINSYQKSCTVCRFAVHDAGLDDSEEVICTLNPNKPITKNLLDTCESQEPKYAKMKIVVDRGHLMEYDSDKAMPGKSNKIPDLAIEKIGEEQWQ
jgi:hypothetical protein